MKLIDRILSFIGLVRECRHLDELQKNHDLLYREIIRLKNELRAVCVHPDSYESIEIKSREQFKEDLIRIAIFGERKPNNSIVGIWSHIKND